jgi:hypothetical protein
VQCAIYESLRETVWLAKHTTLPRPACLQPNPRLSEWHFGARLDRSGRDCGCTSGTCYITRDVGSLEFKRVHKERACHWQAPQRKLLEHVSPNTHGARHVSGCLLSEAGLRNVQHAVYVGVEHWRQLHSWPCDRNRNEGNIRSSQQ